MDKRNECVSDSELDNFEDGENMMGEICTFIERFRR